MSGAVILPRQRSGKGLQNWPKCMLCNTCIQVHSFDSNDFLTDPNVRKTALRVKCYGIPIDPTSGMAQFGFAQIHPVKEDFIVLEKGPGFTMNRLRDILPRLGFFGPLGDRKWQQTVTIQGAKPR
jgi:hypothetical protein